MADNKTWTVVGTSVKNGDKKLRLANGTAAAREKVLLKDNHSDVRLFDLPQPMTADAAREWLAAQGDAVPERVVSQPKERKAREPGDKPARGVKPGRVTAGKFRKPRGEYKKAEFVSRERTAADGELPHEALGKARQQTELLRFLKWEELSLVSQQEHCRNAAWAAGIPVPAGTYPELEAWLLSDGVVFGPDGTVIQDGTANA